MRGLRTDEGPCEGTNKVGVSSFALGLIIVTFALRGKQVRSSAACFQGGANLRTLTHAFFAKEHVERELILLFG